jgi:hypothetical protein
MSREEIYEATKRVYALYGAFFGAVAREVGAERALALHAQAHEEQGLASGKLLKQKLGERPDIETLGSVLRASNLSIGIDSQLTAADSSSALFSNSQCPMYDGYRMGGLDDKTAEALCQRGAAAKLGTMLTQLDPSIAYHLKHYRSRPDGPCEEEIIHVSSPDRDGEGCHGR